MMKKIIVAILLLAAFGVPFLAAQSLPKFEADLGKKSSPFGDIRIPYTSVIKYFGFVKPGSEGDAVTNGRKMFYIYVWIPVVAPEIGVRMVSPVTTIKPDKGDFVSPLWADGSKDTKSFFDTWITFERANEIINPADVAGKIKTATWTSYGSNDDSSELPAQPSGNKYNSVLRITSEPSNPAKALIRGLYRIGFTTYKKGEVQGTFYAEIGAPISLPGVIVEKDVAQLIEALKAAK
jgi:hypothetical protein